MKKFVSLLFALILSNNLLAGDVLGQYSKIQLRPLPSDDDGYYSPYETGHIGVVLTWKDPVRLGVYGAKKNDTKYENEKFTYELLGEVELGLTSVGITLNIVSEADSEFTLNRVDGSQLDDICGNYVGGKIGLSLWLGTTAFSSMNSRGIILRSNARDAGIKGDLSIVDLKLRCLDSKNPNWKKIMRFK